MAESLLCSLPVPKAFIYFLSFEKWKEVKQRYQRAAKVPGRLFQASSVRTWLSSGCVIEYPIILLLRNIGLFLEMKWAALSSLQNNHRGLEEQQSSLDSTLAHLSRLRGWSHSPGPRKHQDVSTSCCHSFTLPSAEFWPHTSHSKIRGYIHSLTLCFYPFIF